MIYYHMKNNLNSVSGDQKGLEGPKTPPTVTPEQAQKEREERIARRRTRKAE